MRRGTDAHLMVLAGGDAGLRLGEIIALEWPDIEDKVWPIRMGERPVRARLALAHPSRFAATRREPVSLSWRASCSRRLEGDVEELGGLFPVLEALALRVIAERIHQPSLPGRRQLVS